MTTTETNDDQDRIIEPQIFTPIMGLKTLAHSIVKKKNRLRMYWARGLILTNEPKLYYYKPQQNAGNGLNLRESFDMAKD